MHAGHQWFETQLATVPSALRERLRADVAPLAVLDSSGPINAAADALIRIIQERIQSMWDAGGYAERADALQLLGIDALVTYTLAFIAEYLPGDLDAYTTRLLRVVAAAVRSTVPPHT